MAKKFKTTAFARFFLVMIILTPLTYIGASYINGEDGIQKVKELVGIDAGSADDQSTKRVKRKSSSELDRLRAENKELKQLIEQKDKEIEALEQQLRNQ